MSFYIIQPEFVGKKAKAINKALLLLARKTFEKNWEKFTDSKILKLIEDNYGRHTRVVLGISSETETCVKIILHFITQQFVVFNKRGLRIQTAHDVVSMLRKENIDVFNVEVHKLTNSAIKISFNLNVVCGPEEIETKIVIFIKEGEQ